MQLKNILVPYDSSSYSKHALNFALELGKKFDSTITVFTSILSNYPTYRHSNFWSSPSMQKQEIKEVKKEFSKLEYLGKKAGVIMKFQIKKSASEVEAILNFAKNDKSDLIIMGRRGRTGFKKILLGSVSNSVSQHASCSVLICR